MIKTCIWPDGCKNMTEGKTDHCGKHNRILRKIEEDKERAEEKRQIALAKMKVQSRIPSEPINKVSERQSSENSEYLKDRKPWIEGKMCAVFPNLKATQVHHMKGRGRGYADDWARLKGITLLHDQRFWLPVSDEGHHEINTRDGWAREMGFVLSRLENLDQEPEVI